MDTIIHCSVTGILWCLVFVIYVKEVEIFWLKSDIDITTWIIKASASTLNLLVDLAKLEFWSVAAEPCCPAFWEFPPLLAALTLALLFSVSAAWEWGCLLLLWRRGRAGGCCKVGRELPLPESSADTKVVPRYLGLAGGNQNATPWLLRELKICLQQVTRAKVLSPAF